jgi:hypothetical protein
MRWHPVESSNLKRVRYFRGLNLLLVEFKDRYTGEGDRIWLYMNVPFQRYRGLLRAGSHGEYFARYIRLNPDYPRQEIPRSTVMTMGLL